LRASSGGHRSAHAWAPGRGRRDSDSGSHQFTTGTEPDILAKVLQERYRPNGLLTEYRAFKDLEELKSAGLTLAILKFNALQDHCVTIFGVQSNGIDIADPLTGLNIVPRQEFENKWQFVGIVFKRADWQLQRPTK